MYSGGKVMAAVWETAGCIASTLWLLRGMSVDAQFDFSFVSVKEPHPFGSADYGRVFPPKLDFSRYNQMCISVVVLKLTIVGSQAR